MAVGSNRYTIVLRTELDTRNTGPSVSDTHAACPYRIPRTNELKQGGHPSPCRPREVDKEEKSVVEFRATQCLVYQLRARGTLIHPVTHTRAVDKCGDRTAGRLGEACENTRENTRLSTQHRDCATGGTSHRNEDLLQPACQEEQDRYLG